ncbi:MAG: carbohydrate kinase family protein [Anaerolineae bacterium]|nr:carbohydrate kinase family protein [Anaerolineae bacterium]
MDQRPVLVIGTSIMDTKGQAFGPLMPGTPNPGHVRISAGGVGRNVAENLARLGIHTILFSAVGDDEEGRYLLKRTAEAGVDVSQVLVTPAHPTGEYLVVLDEAGTPAISISDTRVIEAVTPAYVNSHRRYFRDAAMVILDANLSPATIISVLKAAKRAGIPVCADPTAMALAPKLRRHLPELYMVTPNMREAEVLCGECIGSRDEAITVANSLVRMGVEVAIIALAELGVVYATAETSGHVPAFPCEIVDLTGAGDALTAGVVFGLLHEMPLDEAVRLGAAAAAFTVQNRETVHSGLTLERLYDQM